MKQQLRQGLISVFTISLLAGLLYGAVILANTPAPDCQVTTAIVTQFEINDYIPPLYYKWINISFIYDVENKPYTRNIFINRAIDSDINYYTNNYSPVGRNITIAYVPSNPLKSNASSGCPYYSGWSLLLSLVFSVVFLCFCGWIIASCASYCRQKALYTAIV